jgi:hypothetical protein
VWLTVQPHPYGLSLSPFMRHQANGMRARPIGSTEFEVDEPYLPKGLEGTHLNFTTQPPQDGMIWRTDKSVFERPPYYVFEG